MANETLNAFNQLSRALEAFHNAVLEYQDPDAPAVIQAAEQLADAYTIYDDAIYTQYGVEAPFDTFVEEEYLEDLESDSDFVQSASPELYLDDYYADVDDEDGEDEDEDELDFYPVYADSAYEIADDEYELDDNEEAYSQYFADEYDQDYNDQDFEDDPEVAEFFADSAE